MMENAILLDMYTFLEALRKEGTVNMFGAGPYLQRRFQLSRREAMVTLNNWFSSFDLPEDEQPADGRLRKEG